MLQAISYNQLLINAFPIIFYFNLIFFKEKVQVLNRIKLTIVEIKIHSLFIWVFKRIYNCLGIWINLILIFSSTIHKMKWVQKKINKI